jgi:hypothetical protein
MGFEWSAWWQYEWMTDHALVEALSDERVPPPVSKSIEEAAFLSAPVRPEAEYWLTRARLLRSSEDPELALLCLDRCLATSASHRVARYETAVILRGLGRRRDAREFLATDEARAIGTDEAFASLRELLDMELAGDMSSAGATDQARYQRLLVKASLWDDAFGAIRRSCQAGGQAPADVYAMLFQCYRGQNRTLRAVGAAVMHNRSAAEDARVPPVEIDNLRWRHRHVKMGQLFGEVAVLLDIGRFQEAVTLMRQQGALPSKDETLAPSRAFEMSQLLQQPEVKADALELLRAAGESELIGRLGLARVAA